MAYIRFTICLILGRLLWKALKEIEYRQKQLREAQEHIDTWKQKYEFQKAINKTYEKKELLSKK